MSTAHAAPYTRKAPTHMVIDDVVDVFPSLHMIHPILRVRPVSEALWNIYGPPPLALWAVQKAFDEILAYEGAVADGMHKQSKKGRRK